MKKNGKKQFISGIVFMAAFVIWTWLIQKVDVQPVGQKGTVVGFAVFNCWFHKLTGVLSVMPTLMLQTNCRIKNRYAKRIIYIFTVVFSAFMVIGRLIAGVHWFTDIVGAVFLSTGLFYFYKAIVLRLSGDKK